MWRSIGHLLNAKPWVPFGLILGVGLAFLSARREISYGFEGERFATELLIDLVIFVPVGLIGGAVWYRMMRAAGFGGTGERK